MNTKYTDQDKAPFYVMLEKPNINEIECGMFLAQSGIKGIEEVRKQGRNCIRVKVKTKTAANDILSKYEQ